MAISLIELLRHPVLVQSGTGSSRIETGYSGNAPGQDLTELFARFTSRDLINISGEEVFALLDDKNHPDQETLISAAVQTLRSDFRTLSNPEITKLVLRNLSNAKVEELKARLVREGISLSEISTSKGVSILAGFLGLQISNRSIADVTASFGLFDHQRTVVRRAYKKIGGGSGRTVIHMPTGAGKTRTAMHLACRIIGENEPCSILWLANGRELLEQAAEAFLAAWSQLGNRQVSLHRFWGDHQLEPSKVDDGLIVAGFQKMHSWRKQNPTSAARLRVKTRLVIVDEAHQAIASTYQSVIESIAEVGQWNAILGLTATPGRTWDDIDADTALVEFFNGSKVVLEINGYDNPVKYLLSEGYLSRPNFRQIQYEDGSSQSQYQKFDNSSMDDYSDEELQTISKIRNRNQAIIEAILDLIARGHKRIIVFAASVDHARLLSTVLQLKGFRAPILTGTTPAVERSEVIRNFQNNVAEPVILLNFGVLTTGFDAPKTSAAIIARPTRSLVLFSQMVGRATRGTKAGGNSESEIITVHDPSCPGFGDIADGFFNWEDVWNE